MLPARSVAADVFEYLPPEYQEELLKALGTEDVAAILNEMAPDDRTALLEELPASATRHLLNMLTPAEREIAKTLLGYPEDSIGRLMTPDYVAVRSYWTIEKALDHIRMPFGNIVLFADVVFKVVQFHWRISGTLAPVSPFYFERQMQLPPAGADRL